MSIFGTIMSKIFHSAEAAVAPATATQAEPVAETPISAAASPSPSAAAPAVPSAQPAVDVVAVCSAMAARKAGGGNWQTSIVDLLKLLDLDSSLAARKQLAQELGVHVGADGTAEENIALHKAVMAKLAENGGKVPDSMKG